MAPEPNLLLPEHWLVCSQRAFAAMIASAAQDPAFRSMRLHRNLAELTVDDETLKRRFGELLRTPGALVRVVVDGDEPRWLRALADVSQREDFRRLRVHDYAFDQQEVISRFGLPEDEILVAWDRLGRDGVPPVGGGDDMHDEWTAAFELWQEAVAAVHGDEMIDVIIDDIVDEMDAWRLPVGGAESLEAQASQPLVAPTSVAATRPRSKRSIGLLTGLSWLFGSRSGAGFALGRSAITYGAVLVAIVAIAFVQVQQKSLPTVTREAVRTKEEIPPTLIVIYSPDPKSLCVALERVFNAVGGRDVTEDDDGNPGNCRVQFNVESNAENLDAIRQALRVAGVDSTLSGLVTIRVRAPLPPIPIWKIVLSRIMND